MIKRRVDVVLTLLTLMVILVVAYGAYAKYISYYYSFVIVLTVVLFYLILITMSTELRKSLSRVENTIERWIKNEDIRRDLEVLPVFVEERKREYLKGLHKGYEDISNVLNALKEIKDKIDINLQSETLADINERLTKCEYEIKRISRRMRSLRYLKRHKRRLK